MTSTDPTCVTDCAAQITFSVNGQRSVDTGVSLTVGDVITCSAEDALSYHWTNLHNDNDEQTYGKTISVSQPGSFNYQCTVFLDCGTDGAVCPFSKNISGLARGILRPAFLILFGNRNLLHLINVINNVKLNQYWLCCIMY